jgi:cell division protein FtsA
MNKIIAGLDIGTSQVKAAVLIKRDKTSLPEVLGIGVAPCSGIRKGVIVDFDGLSKSIQKSVSMAERMSGQKIKKAFINLKGKDVFQGLSYGVTVISAKDGKVSRADIKKVHQQALNSFALASNKQIVHVFPKEYIIDKDTIIDNPLGLKGLKLEVNLTILGADSHHIEALTKVIDKAGIGVDSFIFSFLSCARACLFERETQDGVALLDIGAETSDVVIFKDNNLLFSATLPIGDSHITKDIAIGLKIDLDLAEKIKIKYDDVLVQEKKSTGIINLAKDFNVPLSFSEKMLAEIMRARSIEIFNLVKQELKKFSKKEIFPSGCVITGGGSKLKGVLDIAKEQLEMNVRIGNLSNVKSSILDPSLVAVCGLALWGFEIDEKRSQGILFTDIRDIKDEVEKKVSRAAKSVVKNVGSLRQKLFKK